MNLWLFFKVLLSQQTPHDPAFEGGVPDVSSKIAQNSVLSL